jgi:hypothetical protein
LSVHATHFFVAASQTWCLGSHATQSALVAQVIVGLPFPSVGHDLPAGTQVPKLEHSCPWGQPLPLAASHATQRCSATKQCVRPESHSPHSSSLLQL